MIPDETRDRTEVMVLYKIICRQSWRRLQAHHEACPGSRLEHITAGTYVLFILASGLQEAS